MKHRSFFGEDTSLLGVFYQNAQYHQNHAHLLHRHEDVLELLYIYSGRGNYHVSNRLYEINAGDIVICQPGIMHGEYTLHDTSSVETYCCSYSVPNGFSPPLQIPIVSMQTFRPAMDNLMPEIYRIFTSPGKRGIAQQLALSVAYMVREEYEELERDTGFSAMQKRDSLVRAIGSYIDAHYCDDLSLQEISEAVHSSPSTVSHSFKKETGFSPMQYVTQRRIGEAQSMLAETDIPIKDIEEKLGFLSSSHFIKMFKKYAATTPSEYRRNFRKR